MVKKAVKKAVKRTARKAPAKRTSRSSTATKKVVKELTPQEKLGFRWDRLNQRWVREPTLNDLSSLLTNLSIRVTTIEHKIEAAEKAGAKVHADLEQWRKHSAPKWKARQPSDGKPSISHAKVLIMTRDGTKTDMPHPVDAYSWGELGDRTIIAYAVV